MYLLKKNNLESVWFHAVSVGELMSILPVLRKLEKNEKINQIIVTSSTMSSAKIFEKQKFKNVVHKYFPIDTNYLNKKFINYWKPQAAFFVDLKYGLICLKILEKIIFQSYCSMGELLKKVLKDGLYLKIFLD